MYEAHAEVLVEQEQWYQQDNLAVSDEERQAEGLPRIKIDIPEDPERLGQLMPTLAHAVGSRSVAKEAIRRLGLGITPDELLDNLRARQVEGTGFIRISYEHPNVVVAADVVNTMANVSSERISDTSNLTATLLEKARVPDNPTPVSPNPLRNGLLTLVIGLALSTVLIAVYSWLHPRR
jgi:capsular polysaccharide biosynthesis protein